MQRRLNHQNGKLTEKKEDKTTAANESSGKEKKDNSKMDAATNTATTEIGGPKGKEPTRFGDWERNGRISDF